MAHAKNKEKGYKKNYLKSVILRIDFERINLGFLKDYYSEINKFFPFQQQEALRNVLVFTQSAKQEKELPKDINVSIWTFHNPTKTKKVQISFDHILIQYDKYSNKNELIKDTESIIMGFIKKSKLETITRIGLRYINEINLNNLKTPFSWDKYINKDLLGPTSYYSKSKNLRLARSIGRLVLKEEDADISFNYGIVNSDFPNESVRKEFLLDYDCYSRFPMGVSDFDIINVVKKFNSYIEEMFEKSITDDLRVIMKK